jgi:hypothetical protein
MNDEELKRLIEKYYNGESDEQDEMSLRNFFASNSPAGYEAEKEIFTYFPAQDSVTEASPDLETRIMARIDSLEAGRSNLKRYLLPALNIAAGLLILAGTYFFFAQRGKSVDTFSDPAIAYAETMKILYSVSEQMNKGERAMKPVGKMNEMTSKGFKAINESSGKLEKNFNLFSRSFENAGEQLENKKTKNNQ